MNEHRAWLDGLPVMPPATGHNTELERGFTPATCQMTRQQDSIMSVRVANMVSRHSLNPKRKQFWAWGESHEARSQNVGPACQLLMSSSRWLSLRPRLTHGGDIRKESEQSDFTRGLSRHPRSPRRWKSKAGWRWENGPGDSGRTFPCLPVFSRCRGTVWLRFDRRTRNLPSEKYPESEDSRLLQGPGPGRKDKPWALTAAGVLGWDLFLSCVLGPCHWA